MGTALQAAGAACAKALRLGGLKELQGGEYGRRNPATISEQQEMGWEKAGNQQDSHPCLQGDGPGHYIHFTAEQTEAPVG